MRAVTLCIMLQRCCGRSGEERRGEPGREGICESRVECWFSRALASRDPRPEITEFPAKVLTKPSRLAPDDGGAATKCYLIIHARMCDRVVCRLVSAIRHRLDCAFPDAKQKQ